MSNRSKSLRALIGVATVGILPLGAQERVMLKDADEKIGLRIHSVNRSSGGRVETEGAGAGSAGSATVAVTRTRQIERRYLPDPLGGKLRYHFVRDQVASQVDGESRQAPGPLHGKRVTGTRNGAGNWVFDIEGGVAVGDQVEELDLLGAFENKRWQPNRMVQVGDSWDFTPRFIRQTLKRDLPASEAVGVMKLREIGKAADGSRQAVIDCVIHGGGEQATGGGLRKADATLSGVMTVNLDRPGELRLRLSGTLVSGAEVGAARSTAKMPLTMTLETTPLPAGPGAPGVPIE